MRNKTKNPIQSREFLQDLWHSYNPVHNRRPVGSNDQADSSGLYFRMCVKINETTFFSLKLFPLISSGPQKPQKLTASKIEYENFGPKLLIPH